MFLISNIRSVIITRNQFSKKYLGGMIGMDIKNIVKSKKTLIYAGIGTVCIIGAVITSSLWNKESGTNTDNQVANYTVSETEALENQPKAISSTDGTAEVEEEKLIMEDGFPKINALVEKYLYAKLESNEKAFEGLVTDTSKIDYDKLQRKVEYIVSYQNIKSYIAKGINEIDYVVYASYDLELPSISTPAPSIDEIYITLDENKNPKVYLGTLSKETNAYLKELRSSEEVSTLVDNVSNELKQAIKSDKDLKDFYDSLASFEES